MDIDGGVSGLPIRFVSSIRQVQCNIQEVNYFLISGDFDAEPEPSKYFADLFLDPLRLEGGEPAEHAPVVSVDGCDDGEVAEAVEAVMFLKSQNILLPVTIHFLMSQLTIIY